MYSGCSLLEGEVTCVLHVDLGCDQVGLSIMALFRLWMLSSVRLTRGSFFYGILHACRRFVEKAVF